MLQNEENNTSESETLMRNLEERISFQRKWKRWNMRLYSSVSVATVLCTTAATVLAGLQYSISASVVAGAATMLVSIDKGFLFSDRWKIHLTKQVELENIKLEFETKQIDLKEAVAKTASILDEYSTKLPTSSRD